MSELKQLQEIKQRFFLMRNGILSDQLRKGGSPFRVIFGLNLPQIVEISKDVEPSAEIAERLWSNTTTRESMLLAAMVYPREAMEMSTALRWATTAPTVEVVDILCHRLLRHCSFAPELADTLAVSSRDIERYCALRLMLNLLPARVELLSERAKKELETGSTLTRRIALQAIDEVDFLNDAST